MLAVLHRMTMLSGTLSAYCTAFVVSHPLSFKAKSRRTDLHWLKPGLGCPCLAESREPVRIRPQSLCCIVCCTGTQMPPPAGTPTPQQTGQTPGAQLSWHFEGRCCSAGTLMNLDFSSHNYPIGGNVVCTGQMGGMSCGWWHVCGLPSLGVKVRAAPTLPCILQAQAKL